METDQAWRRRMIERTWWALLATGLAVLFMLLTANLPSADDVFRGIIPAVVGYTLGAKTESRRNQKASEEEEE